MCTSPPSDIDYPSFAEIVRIFVPNDTKQLLVRTTLRHTQTNQFSVVSVSKLSIHEAYHKYYVSPNLYVIIPSCRV